MSSDETKEVLKIASEKLGAQFESIPNKSKSLILFRNSEKVRPEGNNLHFFVFDVESKKITIEEEYDKAEIRWINDRELELRIYPGTVKEGQTSDSYIYIITAKSGGKYKKESKLLISN